MSETNPAVWWSQSLNALIGKQPYGGCFDVMERDDIGWHDCAELSDLPADAVRLGPAPSRDEIAALFRSGPGETRLGDEPPGVIADRILELLVRRTEEGAS